MFSKIIVPLDGSAFAEQSLPYAKSLAEVYKASLHLVTVVDPAMEAGVEAAAPVEGVDAERATKVANVAAGPATRYLGNVARDLHDAGLIAQHEVREDLTTADQLIEAIADRGADLVIIATHGRGGLERTVLGSVADQLIRESDVPVLVVRPEHAVSS